MARVMRGVIATARHTRCYEARKGVRAALRGVRAQYMSVHMSRSRVEVMRQYRGTYYARNACARRTITLYYISAVHY